MRPSHEFTLGQGAEKDPIRQAAEVTGGIYFHVDDGQVQELFEVYRNIGRGMAKARLVQ